MHSWYTLITLLKVPTSNSDPDSWSLDSPISSTFFYQIKNFLFLLWVILYMITAIYLHDPPPLNGLFFMTPPFSASQKVETLPPFPHPSPLLISDKSLAYFEPTGSCFPNLICSRIVRVCKELSVHKYSKNFSSPCFNMPSKPFRTN